MLLRDVLLSPSLHSCSQQAHSGLEGMLSRMEESRFLRILFLHACYSLVVFALGMEHRSISRVAD